jgi:chlorobactene glucosyltransferase
LVAGFHQGDRGTEKLDTLLGYQLGLLVILVVLFANTVIGLRALVRLSVYRSRRRATSPLVSVLVPARNAARTITPCLEALLAQDYPNFEVLVLDDHSQDRTGLIAAAIAEHDLRLRLVHPPPRPSGWLDRSWTCHQLAQEAAGDYFLFTRPDTILHPSTLAAAIEAAEFQGGDLLSVWSRQLVNTFEERMLAPLQRFLVFCFLPVRFIDGRSEAHFAAANSQFMLFRRVSYQAAGGYQAVRGDPPADVALARRLQQGGGRLILLDGTGLAQVTTTSGAGQLWRDLSLKLFATVNYSLPLLVATLVLLIMLFVAPFGFTLGALATGQLTPAWLWLPLYQVAVIGATWLLIAQRFTFPLVDSMLHPVAVLVLAVVAAATVGGQFVRASLGQPGGRGPAGPEDDESLAVHPRRRIRQRDD